MTVPELRVAFYAALNDGNRRVAHRLARRLIKRSRDDAVELGRWRRWYRATKRGHRVATATAKAEILVAGEIAAMDEARGFLGDDARVAEAVAQLEDM